MSQSLAVYNLGQNGVDLVNSPIQVSDGALLQCQNGQIFPNDADLAIRKRDGIVKINQSQAPGTILAIANIPLADPS
jgi:hypothetical protein